MAKDTAPPSITMVGVHTRGSGAPQVRARVHDRKSPSLATEWKSVSVEWSTGAKTLSAPMRWYGEYLWRADLPASLAAGAPFQVCATDAGGNRNCVPGPR